MALCTGAMFDLKIGGGSCSLVIFIDAAQPRNKSTAHLNIAMVEAESDLVLKLVYRM